MPASIALPTSEASMLLASARVHVCAMRYTSMASHSMCCPASRATSYFARFSASVGQIGR
eukprot:5284690-Prymnesium_polylepis.1